MAKRKNKSKDGQKAAVVAAQPEALPLSGELGRILRPQAAYRWLLPQLAAITPTYIENILRGALMGNHVQAWELFDLMEDSWPRLVKNENQLKREVVSEVCGWRAKAFQVENEPITDSAKARAGLVNAALFGMRPSADLDENDFAGTVYDLTDAWFKGVTLLEVNWSARSLRTASMDQLGKATMAPKSTSWVHPVCYAWDQNGRVGLRRGLLNPVSTGAQVATPNVWASTSWEPRPNVVDELPPNKFLVGISKAKSGNALACARLRSLAWWWCAANFSSDWLLNRAQIFGVPIRWATYRSGSSQATIDAICDMLERMGSAGYGAFPEGTTLEKMELGNPGDSAQGDMIDRADKNCDLICLGQTLTSDVGSQGSGSRALGEVHETVEENLRTAVCNFVAGVLNGQLIPWILELNYGLPIDELEEVPSFKGDEEEPGTLEFKRQVLANLTSHPRVSVVITNLLDVKQLARDAGLAVNEEYDEPYLPVRDESGQLVNGEVIKDGEGDIVGGDVTEAVQADAMENGSLRTATKSGDNAKAPGGKDAKEANTKDGDEKDEKDLEGKEGENKFERNAAEGLALALQRDLKPVAERLQRVLQISEPSLFEEKLRELLADIDRLQADLERDPAVAVELQKVLAAAWANGLTERKL